MKPFTHKDAEPYRPLDWTGIHPPAIPRKAVPGHVAIVMDGNGRWAKQRGLPRTEGHAAGEDALWDTVKGAVHVGVRWLTVFAFSTENWRRPPFEVRYLMDFNRGLLRRRRDVGASRVAALERRDRQRGHGQVGIGPLAGEEGDLVPTPHELGGERVGVRLQPACERLPHGETAGGDQADPQASAHLSSPR